MYYQHRIYCDLDYKSLTSIVADCFVSSRYYDYATENLFVNTKKIYDYEYRAHFSVVIARALMDVSGSISVSSENLKGKYSKGELRMKDLPLKVQQRFKNIPNILTIDLHRFYYKVQVSVVEQITQKLIRLGYETYDDCFNGQLLSVFDNIQDEEERIASIHILVKDYFSSNNLPGIDLSRFCTDFSLLLPNLYIDSIKALKTAEYLYNLEDELCDYSPIIIAYCKVIEIEVDHKILQPLKTSFQHLDANSINSPNSIKKLKTFVFSPNKSIELGTFANLLEKIVSENINDSLATKLIEIIEELPFRPNLKIIIQEIFELTRNYRNKAAHKAILTKQDMINCRQQVLGDNSNLGLIGKIVRIG